MSNNGYALPKERNWELVLDEKGEVKLMVVEDGKLAYYEPFRFECNHCGQIAVQPEPVEPKFCVHCQKRVFTPLFPKQLKTLFSRSWHVPWHVPPKPVEADVLQLYTELRECLKKHLVLKDECEYDVLAVWILATWLVDFFKTVPYIFFRGEVESGKTRALEMISQLGYHTIPTVGISPAVLRKQVEWFRCTCAIDQAEDQLNKRFESGEELYRLVAAGYKRGMYVAKCRKDNPELVDYDDPFGFKAFASTKSFDEAIDSRSIIIDMREAIPEFKDIDEEWCSRLRGKLLWWRLKGPMLLKPVKTELTGRSREIFMPLLEVAALLGVGEKIEEFAKKQRELRRKELGETVKSAVVEAVFQIVEQSKAEVVYVSEIKAKLATRGLELSSTRIGKLLKDLGIVKDRDSKGVYLRIADNKEQLEYLKTKYSIKTEENKQTPQATLTKENVEKIFEALANASKLRGSATTEEIAMEAKLPVETVKACLEALQREGRVYQPFPDWWKLG